MANPIRMRESLDKRVAAEWPRRRVKIERGWMQWAIGRACRDRKDFAPDIAEMYARFIIGTWPDDEAQQRITLESRDLLCTSQERRSELLEIALLQGCAGDEAVERAAQFEALIDGFSV